jgi:hypothetical protein
MRITEYEKAKTQWERSDRVALMIMTKMKEHFQGSSKTNASMLMTKMINAKYTGQGSVREHIMTFIDMSTKC